MNLNIVQFYRNQLKDLKNIGIGKKTNSGTMVTQGLIDITEKRLNQLTPLKGFSSNSLCAKCNKELNSIKLKEKE